MHVKMEQVRNALYVGKILFLTFDLKKVSDCNDRGSIHSQEFVPQSSDA